MLKKLQPWSLKIAIFGGILVLLAAFLLVLRQEHSPSHVHTSKLSVGPNLTSPGTTVMVTGFDYQAAKNVEIYFQSRANGVVKTITNAGGFFTVPLTLPKKYMNGPSYVYVASDNSVTKAQIAFIQPTLKYRNQENVGGARPGFHARLALEGVGFIANTVVKLALQTNKTNSKITSIKTDSQGHFALSVKSPDITLGDRAILTATDSTSAKVSTRLNIPPTIIISPPSGKVAQLISVAGRGFLSGAIVNVSFQGSIVKTVTTDLVGHFVTSFRVPLDAKISDVTDPISVSSGGTSVTSSIPFQVQPDILSTVGESGSSITPGKTTTVEGSQFTPNGSVKEVLFDPTLTICSAGVPLGTIIAEPNGRVIALLTIPNTTVTGKTYDLLLVDQETGVSTTIPIHVAA